MAIRNIVKEGDPILNKVCRPVTTFDDRLATLLDDMHETMIAADGVGLAGPQVGMLRRLFVVWDTTDAPEEIPKDYEYKFIDFINPEILAVSEEEETAYELASRRRITGKNDYEKIVRFLSSRGYPLGLATRTARRVLDESKEEDES